MHVINLAAAFQQPSAQAQDCRSVALLMFSLLNAAHSKSPWPEKSYSKSRTSAESVVWPLQVVKRREDEPTVTASLDAAMVGQTHLTSLSSSNMQ